MRRESYWNIGTFIALVVITSTFFVSSAEAVNLRVVNDGPVNAYFAGSSASYDSNLKVIIGDGPSPLTQVFGNRSEVGDSVNLGSFTSGTFFSPVLEVSTTGDLFWATASQNTDGFNHLFVSEFNLPGGGHAVFVGFEDIRGLGDADFNDHMAIFTNLEIAPVPEPSTYAMLLAGLLLVGFYSRKLSK